MTVLWAMLALATVCAVLSWATAMPAARGVSISRRFAEARRIAAEDSLGRRPCDQPLDRPAGRVRRHQPRSYVAHCSGGPALRLRHAPRP